MTTPEPSFSVKVDVANPGQFFACCGLLELASREPGPRSTPCGRFSRGAFQLIGSDRNVLGLVESLAKVAPSFDDGESPDDSLATIILATLTLRLDWWRQIGHGKERWIKTACKLWAGQQTASVIYTTLQRTVVESVNERRLAVDRPFDLRAPLKGRFGFDPGAAWNALDAGFSPNEQGCEVASSPVVELLAAIGLQRFRPIASANERDAFEYFVWSIPLPVSIAPPAAAGILPDTNARCFRFRVASRGRYGYFTTATEIRR